MTQQGKLFLTTPFRRTYFSNVSDDQWDDWRWQIKNRVTTAEGLARFTSFSGDDQENIRLALRDFRVGITPYYLSLIDFQDRHDPMLRQSVPVAEEYLLRAVGAEDPLCEETLSPVPGITHRYPDRVLMVISNSCAIYCRHCTRKRLMYEGAVPELQVERMIAYIRDTPAIRDVVVSGGDPLYHDTSVLESILARLRAIPHVEIIRIGSRIPVVLPQRIDDDLCAMLARYHPIWVNVQFNHPRECTAEAAQACDRLLRAGVPLNNQSVLLKGVNDDPLIMRELVHSLLRMRVRPYYVYQCDPVRGNEHLRTTVARGIEIMESLRGHTSGLAVPTLVVDAPGGGGKIPIGPTYLRSYDAETGVAELRNFRGDHYQYHDPRPEPLPAAADGDRFPHSTWVRPRRADPAEDDVPT